MDTSRLQRPESNERFECIWKDGGNRVLINFNLNGHEKQACLADTRSFRR